MTAALSAQQRTSLEKLVQTARRWIEEDLERTLEGTFGIDTDGRVEDEAGLSLSNAQAAVRADLVEIVEFLRSEGEGAAGSVVRLVREAAFTHTNRLVAVRVAEAIDLLPETMARGVASSGFRDFSELAPTVAATEWGRFAEFVRLCADELAADVPALFDPRNPLLELAMSETVLAKVVEAIAALDHELWAAPDALGWAYQFFNTDEDRRRARYREDGSPKPPGSSKDLAVRNQFFTPNYVVEFLVQNGLGAHLAAGFQGLADDLPLLVEKPGEPIEVDLDKVSVLDPACGSGHFLLGAYDVLEKAWQRAGVEPADSAPSIVRSLWGIDIDPRATQIAQAAVIFRARRHCRDDKLPPANVICARALPAGPEVDALIASLPPHVGRAVKGIADELVDAPILGPLLKAEERLYQEVRDLFGTGVVEGTLSETAGSDAESIEVAVLAALSTIADSTTSTAAQRLFAAEARDAVRFVEAMARRYTAVLMNPPFGEPVPRVKAYLKAAYPWIPTKDFNLLAAFVGRGLELAEVGGGTCGAVTSRSGFFIKTFEEWRRQVLMRNQLLAFADLGYGVMEHALVEAAALVVRIGTSVAPATFLNLLRRSERESALTELTRIARSGGHSDEIVRTPLARLSSLPRAPLAYWVSDRVVAMFADNPPYEGNGGEVRVGLQTSDNFRFTRAFWEVDPNNVGFDASATDSARWVPFAKGGEYQPYWADVHLLLDWKDDGQAIRNFPAARPQNTHYFFRPGVTWSAHTTSGFSPRLLPGGCAFGDVGPGAFPCSSTWMTLGWMLSRPCKAMIDLFLSGGDEVTSGGAKRIYGVGVLQSLPWPEIELNEIRDELERLTRELCELERRSDLADERTRLFASFLGETRAADWTPGALWRSRLARVQNQLQLSQALDRLVCSALGLDAEAIDQLDRDQGPHPLNYDEDKEVPTELLDMRIDELIDAAVEDKGGARFLSHKVFFADRRIEVLAHAQGISAESVIRTYERSGIVPHDELLAECYGLISYLVGVAFGRWDLRFADGSAPLPQLPDPLDHPRRTPLGSLDELTVAIGRVEFNQDALLLDQAGHPWDLGARTATVAHELFGSDAQLGAALATVMKKPSLPMFLRSHFFKHHLSMYSMSRRQAPIYWQLQVPSKNWGLWLYAPKLSREMLFAVVRETEQRQRLAEQQIGHLQREAEAGSGGRKASDVAKELEAERKLAVELKMFRSEAERIANLGWEPDLDDGMVLNAAPLADLFPAWRDAAKYRKELRAGRYEWATVAQYADRL